MADCGEAIFRYVVNPRSIRMKYHESAAQANDIMRQVMKFLSFYHLAANPINYTVAYEFIVGKNTRLVNAIKTYKRGGKAFDNFVMDNWYNELVLKQDDLQDQIVEKFDDLLDDLNEGTAESTTSIDGYVDNLNQSLVVLSGPDTNADDLAKKTAVIKQLLTATQQLKLQQQQLQASLVDSSAKTELLRNEIDNLNKQRRADELTGLFRAPVLQQHLDKWLALGTDRQVAAIAIDIDHFREFNDNYGFLVGDVVLSKVARKISHYVAQSGVPVRSGGEEFVILLPDMDLNTANEVAEQVRKGVEKMKFVSARSKRSLPSVTISIGTATYQRDEPLDSLVNRAEAALTHAKSAGRNRVSSELMFS